MSPKKRVKMAHARKQGTMPYRVFNHVFMKIAEPRIVRVIYFGIYGFFVFGGLGVLIDAPRSFEFILGSWQVNLFAGFLILGGVFGGVAVLPGIWWLERVGLISLGFGVAHYVIVVASLGTSPLGIGISMILLLVFLLRWLDIKEFQLAPKER